ncbi:histidine phosphatase family protein [Bacillus spongiae]|uniref:phosphoglycerate mutase (2,3-diphosphoglycerate-dependent) n=1 Tax=Bacillus spongiae TaxID=2683610 RepID=A0ABU8HBM9_9BACI
MLSIYLTRHGETEWNTEHRLQGTKDSALTEKGVNAATALGKRLTSVPFDAVYTSSSNRARTTAKILVNHQYDLITPTDALKEINFGQWEGKTSDEIQEEYPAEFDAFWNSPHTYNHLPHQGEALQVFQQRIEKALLEITQNHTTGNVLIVAHAVVIKVILTMIKQTSLEYLWDPPFIEGTSLTLIKVQNGEFHLELVGDMSHVEKQLTGSNYE